MIKDSLAHAQLYCALGPRLDRGLRWLADFDPATADGRIDLEGDNLFALVQSYESVDPREKKFESHRDYLDVQYVAAGAEIIHHADTGGLTPVTVYDAERDFVLYADPAAGTPVRLDVGEFVIFFPHDGHKPGCSAGAPARIKKVVLKVHV